MHLSFFWFRRDLRLEDNTGLINALNSDHPVQPIFIFDTNILQELPEDDARVSFIYSRLKEIDKSLRSLGSSLYVIKGDPREVWTQILSDHQVAGVYLNRDYEPYARSRDKDISDICSQKGVGCFMSKDQVIFEESEVVKADGSPYTVFTPFKNKWLERFDRHALQVNEGIPDANWNKSRFKFPSLTSIGFVPASIKVRDFNLAVADGYESTRNFPAMEGTSNLGPHLRFGTVSIREIIQQLTPGNSVFLSELIWREFFMQILYHFPDVVQHNFKRKYDNVPWRNNRSDFERWCAGQTGYPMVDAGMRELNATGYMHNRVRMVVASFLCKHLLIHWSWGEGYFAEKLLDYELSSNNGNWQWSAGTGCDAAPYFRIFNPHEQLKKFDKNLEYVSRWVPEYESLNYVMPIVEHKAARKRALEAYKEGLQSN